MNNIPRTNIKKLNIKLTINNDSLSQPYKHFTRAKFMKIVFISLWYECKIHNVINAFLKLYNYKKQKILLEK